MSFTPVNKFTVDRSRWGHGLNGQEGSLLKDNGCMCVLGFYGKACGLEDKELIGRGQLNNYEIPWPQHTAYHINDRGENKHGLAYKEQRLINFFKRQGIKLTFKGRADKKLAK